MYKQVIIRSQVHYNIFSVHSFLFLTIHKHVNLEKKREIEANLLVSDFDSNNVHKPKLRMPRIACHWIPGEIWFLIVLALPSAMECFSEGLQMKLSNVFVGRASGSNIALMISALFIGQTVIGIVSYPIAEGFGIYVNVLCSQAYGAKQYKLVGLYFYRALFMAALTCFPVFTVFISVRPIVYLLFQDWELAQYTGSFTDVLCFGYPAYLYYKIGFRFLQALNIVWGPVLYLIIGNILNGVIQYILIFRYNTTLAGAAAGYVISNYLVALLVFTHIQLSHVHTLIAHKWTIEYITNWLHTARYALSTIFQALISSTPLSIFPIIFIGLMADDKRELAIYSILFSIGWVFCLGIVGFSSAVTIRVGYLLGENEPVKARRASIVGILFGLLLLLLCNLTLFGLSGVLSQIFTSDPILVNELTWNIRIFSILINGNVFFIGQGVMNACCKQGIQTILKILFQFIIGAIASGLLVHFVEWKALSIFLQFDTLSILTFIIVLFILYCSNWNKIAIDVSKNTQRAAESIRLLKNNPGGVSMGKNIIHSKIFALSGYIICVTVSGGVFVSVLCFRLVTGVA